MSLPGDPAGRHRAVAAGFAAVARAVPDWAAPTPVPGWAAHHVVGHLVGWFGEFLEAGTGTTLPAGPDPAVAPLAAWEQRSAALQALLEAADPGLLRHPQVGDLPLPEAVDRFYTSDVFMHTWDLARAAGVPHGLDQEHAAELLAGMLPLDELLRSSGHYGPSVAAPTGADAVTRLMAFVGRDPAWAPPA